MGWTHSWERESELPRDEFAAGVADCEKVFRAAQIPLAGMDGSGSPIFQADSVIFNGAAPQHCEPFELHQIEFDRRGRNRFWSSCKTNRAPYDVCVMATLIVFQYHLGKGFRVATDGSSSDWETARTLCNTVLGYGSDFEPSTS